ncbi:Acot10, partial [Symbiodinium microadriaticum]
VDTVEFRRPVDIGDLVRLKSRVVYSSGDTLKTVMHVEVTVQVVRPERASSFVSNTFHFIFGFSDNVTLRRVLPVTNEEAAVLLQASKHEFSD